MVVVLALITAALFGAGDFLGGLAARKTRVVQVVAGSHVIGAIGSVTAALLLAETVTVEALALGALGGGLGLVGVVLLYRRLAAGPMSVVAPLTALTSAVVPTSWGLLGGERLSMLGWFGVVLGLMAVLLVSSGSDGGSGGPEGSPAVTVQVVAESLLAGVGFGGIFIALDATETATAPWPVAAARVITSTVLLGALAIDRRRRVGRAGGQHDGTGFVIPTERRTLVWIGAVGVLDTGANISFLYATALGDLAIVSVLSSLYPISTVVLARLVLGERMSRSQGAGFIVAMGATELLVLG